MWDQLSLGFRNLATSSRVWRFLLGAAMLALGWASGDVWTVWMRIAGLYPLVTGLIGWCPVCALLRLDSFKKSSSAALRAREQDRNRRS